MARISKTKHENPRLFWAGIRKTAQTTAMEFAVVFIVYVNYMWCNSSKYIMWSCSAVIIKNPRRLCTLDFTVFRTPPYTGQLSLFSFYNRSLMSADGAVHAALVVKMASGFNVLLHVYKAHPLLLRELFLKAAVGVILCNNDRYI